MDNGKWKIRLRPFAKSVGNIFMHQLSIINYQLSINLLSHIGFFAAIALSAWFHELRNTFGESAMILFNLINEPYVFAKSTWLSVHWFQNLLTILVVKTGFSISFVSVVFSVAPMIFMYGVFLIVNYVFKQKNSGIFLLLLFLGINQTFFGTVHTPLILVTTLCLLWCGINTLVKKYSKYYSQMKAQETSGWYFACLALIFIARSQVSPNVYSDVVIGLHNFSFLDYFFSVGIGTFVISFGMAAFLGLYWIWEKNYDRLVVFGFWTILMMGLIFSYGRNGLLGAGFELLFFPLIVYIVGWFVYVFTKEIQQTKVKFWILSALAFFAVFGQIRTVSEFQKRQNYVIRLLEHTPKTGDKFALPEYLQQLERYIDPTFLAFETPLLSSLRGLPVQSVFFIPSQSENIPHISENAPNSSFFRFSSPTYCVSDTSFVKRSLFAVLTDTAVVTGRRTQFASTVRLDLNRDDSVSLSVMRKGSDYGRLIIADDLPAHTSFWLPQQFISEPDSEGWQRLSTSIIISKRERYRAYVWNENFRNERIYFRDYRIEIWRE